ncbi:MAG: hypothetical protein AABX49_02060 [Nanoarchaeota archaeon]
MLSNKKVFALLGIEFLFFLLMAVNVTISFSFISENFNELKNFEQGFTVDESASADYIYGSLLSLSGTLDEIFKVAVVSFIIFFLIFGFFAGIAWKFSANLVSRKKLFNRYDAKYFFNVYLLSFIWFLIFAAAFYLLYNYWFSYEIFSVILILFFYFLWISLSCFIFENKVFNSFLKGMELAAIRAYVFIPAFLLLLILLAASSYLFEIFDSNLVHILGSLLGVFIFIWFRIFLILICKESISGHAP